MGGEVITGTLVSIGSNAARSSGPARPGAGGSHLAELVLRLVPVEERDGITASRIAERWRQLTGKFPMPSNSTSRQIRSAPAHR
ncbi:MAG: hypothetical protein U5O39_14235 [Gammaproteobacteria bacterium]|nr:hypothetical protein [Gammaproteobacteria bacterium]